MLHTIYSHVNFPKKSFRKYSSDPDFQILYPYPFNMKAIKINFIMQRRIIMCQKNWKKVLEIILTTTLSFSMIVGCGATKVPAPVPATTEMPNSSDPQDCNESQATAEIHTSVNQEISERNQAMGAVLLSVNPEIEITYDSTGLVIKVEGLNEDGTNVLAHMDDYLNQDCSTVIQKLVKEIYEAGYFEKTIDGRDKNIILKLEEGSIAPSENFLE